MPFPAYDADGEEKIVFGMDIGTTSSAVSFVHLVPGLAPHIRVVSKWPGQEEAMGDCKVPTVIGYRNAQAVAFGVEALEYGDEDSGTLDLARWFKLHLHPTTMRAKTTLEIPPLPNDVSLKRVYADMIGFLFHHAVEFFTSSVPDGEALWQRMKSNFTLILASPNGWDVVQHGFLRDAAVLSEVLPRTHGKERLQFVSEAEASVHFALERTESGQWLHTDTNFAVLDAGGSTVDISLYKCTATAPKLVLKEVTGSECVQAGSVFVDREAENLLRLKLRGSRFGDDEYITKMVSEFEKKTKRRFDGGSEPSVIKFGVQKDTDLDAARAISRGRITLTSDEVKLTFQSCILDIVASCNRIIERSNVVCEAILMVGGFSESKYLCKTLREMYQARGVQIVNIDDSTRKAASEGAVVWFVRQTVIARAVRSTFGTDVRRILDPSNPRHQQREHKAVLDNDGERRLASSFDLWAKKHDVYEENHCKKFNYTKLYESYPEKMGNYTEWVFACDDNTVPHWTHDEDGALMPNVRRVCTVSGDLSGIRGGLRRGENAKGEPYWVMSFSIAIYFGQTSLSAELQWIEDGVTKKGPLTIIPKSLS